MRDLNGHVAIVTGGSSGLGLATALALARAGAHTVVVARDCARVTTAVKELEEARPGGSHLGLALDVRSESNVEHMAQMVMNRFGRIDILVGCAGVARGGSSRRTLPYPIARMPLEEWKQVLDTNLKGTFLCNRAVLPYMIAREQGEIVNVASSRGGTAGQPYAAAYCASKFGVVGFSDALGMEVRPYGIRVQLVFPDAMDTPLLQGSNLASVSLPAARVADLIIYMLGLPDECIMDGLVVAPLAGGCVKSAFSICSR